MWKKIARRVEKMEIESLRTRLKTVILVEENNKYWVMITCQGEIIVFFKRADCSCIDIIA